VSWPAVCCLLPPLMMIACRAWLHLLGNQRQMQDGWLRREAGGGGGCHCLRRRG